MDYQHYEAVLSIQNELLSLLFVVIAVLRIPILRVDFVLMALLIALARRAVLKLETGHVEVDMARR